MQEAALALPDQIEESLAQDLQTDEFPDASDIDQLVVMGMGGSGIAGDIVKAIVGPRIPIPVVVSKGYECPNFVGRRTLVMVVSFSGETEETLHAAATTANERDAHIFAVTCGGTLSRLAEEWQASLSLVDPAIPMPRCAVGAMSVPLLRALDSMGLIEGLKDDFEDAVTTLEIALTVYAMDRIWPRSVGESLANHIPLVYGGEH